MSEKLAEVKKLRNVQMDLEKNINFIIESLKDPSIGLVLLKHSEERNVIYKNIQDTTLSINEMLGEMKTKLTTENCSDYEDLKQNLVNIEEKIKNSKHSIKTKIEDLVEQEICLDTEITNITRRLQCKEAVNMKNRLHNNNSVSKEINQFSKLVCDNIGEEIVWNTDSQKVLFDITRRYKSKEKVLEALKTFIPDLSKQNLKVHEDCYDQYVKFLHKKKETLKKWRESKQKQSNKTEELEMELKERKVANFIRTNPETRQKILIWKAEKKLKIIQEDELKLSYENQLRETEKLKKLQQEKTKEEVDKWKLERQSKIENEEISKKLLEQRQQEFKSKVANKFIKEYQHQDEMYIKRILDDRQKRTNIKPINAKKHVPIKRNPNDLMKPTKQWLARIEIDNTKTTYANISNLENIDKLAVPVWRKP